MPVSSSSSSASRSEPPRPLSFSPVRELTPPREGDAFVSFSISPEGAAVVAWASPADHARLHGRSKDGSFPQTLLAPPGVTLRVTTDDFAGGRQLHTLTGVTPAYSSVHALPGDELLVVGSRAAYRDGDPQHNAVVFATSGSAAGQPVRSACFGDGIGQVAVTAAGAIWIGYFDEGVFGNFGWGYGGDSAPLGAAGWNCYDASLTRVWSHPEPEEGEIADCYALTTTGEDCFVCPYTDWPILRAGGGRFQRWTNKVGGASALLVMGHEVVLLSGYSPNRDRVVAGVLERDHLRLSPGQGQLLLKGEPWNARSPLCTRDGVAHTFFEGTWYSLELPAIVAALA